MEQRTQTSLEDIQLFQVAATITLLIATIITRIAYTQHPPRPIML